VFVYPDPLPEKLGSFHFPSMYAENYRSKFGVVVAVGKGRYDKKFKWHPTTVRPGDRVVYDKDIPWHMDIEAPDGKKHHVKYMPELDIKGIVEEEDEGSAGVVSGAGKDTAAKAV
jgi:co-chaperonin GroES (HSP10)